MDHRLIIRMISASDVSVVKTGQQMLSRREPPQRTSFSRKEIILCCLHTNMLSKCLSSSRRIKRRANRAASHSKHIILQINLQNKKKMTSFIIIIYHHVPLHIQLDMFWIAQSVWNRITEHVCAETSSSLNSGSLFSFLFVYTSTSDLKSKRRDSWSVILKNKLHPQQS